MLPEETGRFFVWERRERNGAYHMQKYSFLNINMYTP